MADFTNGGIFLGPKIRHFRELTVLQLVKMVIFEAGTNVPKQFHGKFPYFRPWQPDWAFLSVEIW